MLILIWTYTCLTKPWNMECTSTHTKQICFCSGLSTRWLLYVSGIEEFQPATNIRDEDENKHRIYLPKMIFFWDWHNKCPFQRESFERNLQFTPAAVFFGMDMIIQEISNRTHWKDPEKTWVSNSSVSQLSERGPLGFGPMRHFWWNHGTIFWFEVFPWSCFALLT